MSQPGREALATGARDLLAAIEAGSDDDIRAALLALKPAAEKSLLVDVAQITRGLHEGLSRLALDAPLAKAADRDLPDMCSRLEAVIHMSEDAAMRTLDLTEAGKAELRLIEAIQPNADLVRTATARLRGHLNGIAEAQAYQDLCGQTIKKVIGLLREVENALAALLAHAGIDAARVVGAPVVDSVTRGHGPRLAGLDVGASQGDADKLLEDLGL